MGCEALWTTGMNDSFHMNAQACGEEEAAKLSEKRKYFIHFKPSAGLLL